MPRGGKRTPDKPAAVSGPGKFSRRTDGQPVRAPDLDTPGQQYGDRKMIEAAQAAAPIRGAQGAAVDRRMQGQAPSRAGLPPWLFQMESANPDEPLQSGLSTGPGPGPEALAAATPPDDIREVVLNYLANTFQNATAIKHLADIRAERSADQPPVSALPATPQLEAAPEAPPTEPTL